eukprot:3845521-Pyramimonas_sp.AAC.1
MEQSTPARPSAARDIFRIIAILPHNIQRKKDLFAPPARGASQTHITLEWQGCDFCKTGGRWATSSYSS